MQWFSNPFTNNRGSSASLANKFTLPFSATAFRTTPGFAFSMGFIHNLIHGLFHGLIYGLIKWAKALINFMAAPLSFDQTPPSARDKPQKRLIARYDFDARDDAEVSRRCQT